MNSLTGKTLIVTGASGGIGRELALELGRSGVNLVLNARGLDRLQKVADECRAAGIRAEYIAGSAASAETCSQLVKTAVELGSFHGFIHVAGVLHPGPFLWELEEDAWSDIFEANLVAGYQLIRAAVPHLKRQGEGIAVFFSSGAAEINIPGIGAYSAAKAAVEHMARQLAVEAPEIATLAFRPGMVATPMQQEAMRAKGSGGEELRRSLSEYIQRGELLSPDVPARALVAILRDDPRRFHGKVANWSDGV